MKKELFRRSTRMVHRMGPLENDGGPFSGESFDPAFPVSPVTRRSPPLSIQKNGEHRYLQPMSPVVKFKGGRASTNGPAPDVPDMLAQPIPPGTKKRKA